MWGSKARRIAELESRVDRLAHLLDEARTDRRELIASNTRLARRCADYRDALTHTEQLLRAEAARGRATTRRLHRALRAYAGHRWPALTTATFSKEAA